MRLPVFAALAVLFTMVSACSSLTPAVKVEGPPKPTIRLTLLPQQALAAGQTTSVLVKLTHIGERRLLTDDDLQPVHNHRVHLLAVDPTLTDYQHLHPEPTSVPGVYRLTFTPEIGNAYRIWADIIPAGTGIREFPYADLGSPRARTLADTREKLEAAAGKYRFALFFDHAPIAGQEVTARIRITTPDGRPVQGDVMHSIGIYSDYHHLLPTQPVEGGEDTVFRLLPYKPGYVRLFALIRTGGAEMSVPFGFTVAPR